MTELLTAAQMRAIEQAAIDSGEVTGLELMERAGAGVVEAIFEEWPELAEGDRRAVILCGPGNNGGDGFAVARLLKERGWEVEVFLYGDPEKLPPDAKVNYERWQELGNCSPLTEHSQTQSDLFIDAVFGTGLTREIEDPDLIKWLEETHDVINDKHLTTKTVAVDLPSGINTDTGMVLGTSERLGSSARAMLTVTFHAKKNGHVLGEGPLLSGKVVVKDIGL